MQRKQILKNPQFSYIFPCFSRIGWVWLQLKDLTRGRVMLCASASAISYSQNICLKSRLAFSFFFFFFFFYFCVFWHRFPLVTLEQLHFCMSLWAFENFYKSSLKIYLKHQYLHWIARELQERTPWQFQFQKNIIVRSSEVAWLEWFPAAPKSRSRA